jgi:hypothetical protein
MIGPIGGISIAKLNGRIDSEKYINDILEKYVETNENIINRNVYF